jgi:hypothetical protein
MKAQMHRFSLVRARTRPVLRRFAISSAQYSVAYAGPLDPRAQITQWWYEPRPIGSHDTLICTGETYKN